MHKLFLGSLLIISAFLAKAQTKVVAECTINYAIGIELPKGTSAEDAASLKSSAKIVYIKGNASRVDLVSASFLQTMIYDKGTGTCVILREMGANKFMTRLDAKTWEAQNSKYKGMVITYLDETKTILGYDCKKAVMVQPGGGKFTVFYTSSIVPSVKEFEYQFKDIPGLVLEYETIEATGQKITYKATSINLNPVQASKFDIPTSGYRMLN